MIQQLLLLIVCVCEYESLYVNPKYRRSNTAVQVKGQFQSGKGETRHKRDASDDHGSDWDNKVKITKSVLSNDAHGTAFVEWGGTDKNSDTIIVLTRDFIPSDSTLYVSTDYGSSFSTVSVTVNGVDAICSYIYQSPSNHKMFMLNDVVNKAVVVSTDEGKSWASHVTDFTPSTIEHHPTVERLLLSHDRTDGTLYLSRDFGQTWESIPTDDAVVDFYWGTSTYDSTNTLFVVTRNPDGTMTVSSSSTFYISSKSIIADGVLDFSVVDDFYFYAKKSTHTDHGLYDQDLFISYDRSPAVKAKFPPETKKNPTTEFYIAEAGEGQAFVAVSHRDNMTHLYITEHKGENMVLSLERVLFTNKASYDTISWLDGIEPFVDLQSVKGLPGVFIASTLDSGEVGHRRIHTVMTFNKGGSWQFVQPPTFDQYGAPTECFLPKCSLHISLFFGIKFPYAQHTPLLSKANAPGIIIASGNLGGSHSPVNDVYISSDGGVEWAQVLDGQFNYQIADHGGIIVAAPKEPTTFVMYSHDEGVTWYNKTISDIEVTIYGLITEPGEITTIFNVYAIETVARMEWVVFTIDFAEFLGSVCETEDFMSWSIRDELKNTECVLGKDTKYERKKPTSHCKIGSDYERFIEDKACPCQATDFECDFLYYRDSAGAPCVMVDGISKDWFVSADCVPGGKYNMTMGYIKIEGDICHGGEEAVFSPKERKCPDEDIKNLTISVSPGKQVPVGSTVKFQAITDTFVEDIFFLWYTSDNFTSNGKGLKGDKLSKKFDNPGTYVVSLTANNGAGPTVAMVVIEVDAPINGLRMQQQPEDPAVGEGVIFIVTTTDGSKSFDPSRMRYQWTTNENVDQSTAADSILPILLHTFNKAGPHTVKVTVSNSINSVDLTAKFVVSDLTVTSLSCIPVSSSSIQVVWTPPSLRPGLVSAYTLKYIGPNMDTWHQLSLGVNDSSPQYRVNDLEPQATYKFIMITTSSGGAMSEESSTVSATTLMLNTRDPVTSVKAAVSGREVMVSWDLPGDKPTGFVVEYWMSDRPGVLKSPATPGNSDTSMKLTDLVVGASYTIRVKALYGLKDTAYSDVVDVQIEGQTPDQIKNLRAFPENSTAIVLVWDSPQAAVDGYHIHNATDSSTITTVTDTTVTITNLLPWTPYLFVVEPFSASRRGIKSDVIPVRTDYGVPDPVKDLQCLMKDGNALLQWHEPVRANGPIVKYLINYDDDSLDKLPIPNSKGPEFLAVLIEGLPEYKKFKFSVTVQGTLADSVPSYATCSITATSGVPGPPVGVYVNKVSIASIDLMWRRPAISESSEELSYEIRYGAYKDGHGVGTEQVMASDQLYTTIRNGISPSTEYHITVCAKNDKGIGQPSHLTVTATLTPAIGSVEYEFKFLAYDFSAVNAVDFGEKLKSAIVDVSKVARERLSGYGLTHQDSKDVKVSIWISPRDSASDSSGPSTEDVIDALDSAIKKKHFTVNSLSAESGKVDHVSSPSSPHHDIAEIIIPGVCGLLVVLLIAGLLYYRNKYQQLYKRHSFRSRYANNDNDDVNMIECADDTEGLTSSDLRGGELSISPEDSHRPSGIRNFFDRFNNNTYSAVAQEEAEELIDDDEEHLLPL